MSSTSGTSTCPNFKASNQHRYHIPFVFSGCSEKSNFSEFVQIFKRPVIGPLKAQILLKMLKNEIITPSDVFLKKEKKLIFHFFDKKNRLSDRLFFVRFSPELSEWRHITLLPRMRSNYPPRTPKIFFRKSATPIQRVSKYPIFSAPAAGYYNTPRIFWRLRRATIVYLNFFGACGGLLYYI